MLTLNPVFAALSLIAALILRLIVQRGRPQIKAILRAALFMALITVLNPVFSHHGVTVLFFLNDLPITREAILYGAYMSAAIMAVVLWCGVLSSCMTSDKVIHLVGRAFPHLAVLISLTLRFIPLFKERFKGIIDAQRAAGVNDETTMIKKLSFYIKAFSALVTMILEDSIDTSDSMKARGITLSGRTSYSDFSFHFDDAVVLALVLSSAAYLMISGAAGFVDLSFYPVITPLPVSVKALAAYAAFGVIAFIPAAKEVIAWRHSRLRA